FLNLTIIGYGRQIFKLAILSHIAIKYTHSLACWWSASWLLFSVINRKERMYEFLRSSIYS
ncbi:MAG: hypothetical protein II453_16700, partial [Alphaproteobacteria bacterium]|nr:hypothetical protein [Alphaproteobacteria bacterium]